MAIYPALSLFYSPPRYFLLMGPSSSSSHLPVTPFSLLLPPCCSFLNAPWQGVLAPRRSSLLIVPTSLLLPPRFSSLVLRCFFFSKICLNHWKFVKIFTNYDGSVTNGRTDKWTDRQGLRFEDIRDVPLGEDVPSLYAVTLFIQLR